MKITFQRKCGLTRETLECNNETLWDIGYADISISFTIHTIDTKACFHEQTSQGPPRFFKMQISGKDQMKEIQTCFKLNALTERKFASPREIDLKISNGQLQQ